MIRGAGATLPRILIRSVRAQHQVFLPRFISTTEYNQVVDEALERMLAAYETLAESRPEVDADLAQGVLTVIVPPVGTYVINKQPPAKQIWLSSPISGPKRFDFIDGKWSCVRDNSTLGELLKSESKGSGKGVLDLDLD